MVTPQTRNAVWQELLDTARLVRYYEALSDRYRRYHWAVRFVLLLSASSGIVALLDLLPESMRQPVQLTAGGFIALTVVWDFVSDYARKAAVLHAISMECSLVEVELKALWGELEHRSDDEVRRNNTQLARKMTEVTGWAGQADVREDSKLNQACATSAYTVMKGQYATQ